MSVLGSTTWEEAPVTWRVWHGQRTRWIKGWLQTYFVHMREPLRLLVEFGPWRFLGFQLLIGGLLASVFLHPLLYILIVASLLGPAPLSPPSDPVLFSIWATAGFNLTAGVVTALGLAGLAVVRRGRASLLLWLPLMPLYWLLVSIAAWSALFELIRAPTRWSKTPHRARTRRERTIARRRG